MCDNDQITGVLTGVVLELLATRCDLAKFDSRYEATVVKNAARFALARLHWAVADLLTAAEGWADMDGAAKSEFRSGVVAAAQVRDEIAGAIRSMLAAPAETRERLVEGDTSDAALAYLAPCQSYMHRTACDLMRLCPAVKFSNTVFAKLAWQVPEDVLKSMVQLARDPVDEEAAAQLDAGFVEELHSSEYAKAELELEAGGESFVSEEMQKFEEERGVLRAHVQAFVFPLSSAALAAPASLTGAALTHITNIGRVEDQIKKMYKLVRDSRGTDFMFASVLEVRALLCIASELEVCAAAVTMPHHFAGSEASVREPPSSVGRGRRCRGGRV